MNAPSFGPRAAPASGSAPDSREWPAQLRDGTTVVIRPMRPTDTSLEREFIERLSPQSRRYRFLGTIKTPSEDLLRQLTHPELVRGIAFIALDTRGPDAQEIGVCRYSASLMA